MLSTNIWSTDMCLILIEEYRQRPVIWNTKNSSARCEKREAWEEISRQLNLDVESVKFKINSILAVYRRERSKLRKAPAGKPYKSSWYAFKALHFLLNDEDYNKANPETKKRISDETSNEPSDFSDQMDHFEDLSEKPEDTDQYETKKFKPNEFENIEIDGVIEEIKVSKVEHSESKKFKQNKIEEITADYLVNENHEQTCTNNEENYKIWKDECRAFGQYITNKLLQYNLRTRAIVEHEISNIIFKHDLEKCNNMSSSSSN